MERTQSPHQRSESSQAPASSDALIGSVVNKEALAMADDANARSEYLDYAMMSLS